MKYNFVIIVSLKKHNVYINKIILKKENNNENSINRRIKNRTNIL